MAKRFLQLRFAAWLNQRHTSCEKRLRKGATKRISLHGDMNEDETRKLGPSRTNERAWSKCFVKPKKEEHDREE